MGGAHFFPKTAKSAYLSGGPTIYGTGGDALNQIIILGVLLICPPNLGLGSIIRVRDKGEPVMENIFTTRASDRYNYKLQALENKDGKHLYNLGRRQSFFAGTCHFSQV